MPQLPFSIFFREIDANNFEVLQAVRIGGVTLQPGARFSKGTSFGGIDLTQFSDRNLEVVSDDGISVITGIY